MNVEILTLQDHVNRYPHDPPPGQVICGTRRDGLLCLIDTDAISHEVIRLVQEGEDVMVAYLREGEQEPHQITLLVDSHQQRQDAYVYRNPDRLRDDARTLERMHACYHRVRDAIID